MVAIAGPSDPGGARGPASAVPRLLNHIASSAAVSGCVSPTPSEPGGMAMGGHDTVVVRRVSDRGVRDVLDQGTDILVTRDRLVVAYAADRPGLELVSLPWDRVYALVIPHQPAVADSAADPLRVSLASDAVHADARAFGTEKVLVDSTCRADTALATQEASTPRAAADRVRDATHILYDQDDSVAQFLAERIAAFASTRSSLLAGPAPLLGRGSAEMYATGLPAGALAAAVMNGSGVAYIIASRSLGPASCDDASALPVDAPSLVLQTGGQPLAIIPLIETRPWAIVRRDAISPYHRRSRAGPSSSRIGPHDVSHPALFGARRNRRHTADHSRRGNRARAGPAAHGRGPATRADLIAAQTRRDVETVASGVAERLGAVRDGLADDNRFRAAAVLGITSERPYLVDYAARAMRLSGLAMLQIENDSGRILSSGHYRNEFDRLDTGLVSLLDRAPAGAALMWARTPAARLLVLARADSIRLGGRWFVLVGGAGATPQRLGHVTADSELSVSLDVPQFVDGQFAPAARVAVPRGSGASLVASFAVPAIIVAPNGARILSSATYNVTQSLSGLRVLRAAVLWWCLVTAVLAIAAAILAANWLAERISRPIRMLAEQSTHVDLVQAAAGFSSDRTDEIGVLSRRLGTMVRRLRTTAAGLREAERRAAVGDLARQVTHDVKNGLVPIRHVVRHLSEIHRVQPEQLAGVFAERRATLDASIGYLDELARNYARLSPRTDMGPCDLNAVAAAVASGYAAPDASSRCQVRRPRSYCSSIRVTCRSWPIRWSFAASWRTWYRTHSMRPGA